MSFSSKLKESIKDFHLLDHPFYQAWNRGELSKETLEYYASQYYHHVEAFPRYISATHSLCKDSKARKLLLENLMDEEGVNSRPHPELWMEFSRALGCDETQVQNSSQKEIQDVISTFMGQSRSSYERGLAALYAYEYQVPEVAETKIEGLQKHFGVTSEKGLSFFKVHQRADVYHREACEQILDQMDPDKQQEALEAAQVAAKSLWNFLTQVYERETQLH
ncbi:MAG: CADD family putative folate metabolism protein [Bdellovibrionales bacterium]|nr:CADD family putative folate metabolism protein [Bdellovibrionales bacterium]